MFLFIYEPGDVYADELEFTKEELDYIKENPVVITAVDPLFHPYEFIDNDGVYKGMSADYLKLIEIRTGFTFEVMEGLTWPEAYDMALKGQADLLPCIGITEERQNVFFFTDDYFQYQRAIFSLEDSPFYSFNDLENISVGVQRNSSHYSYIMYETDIDPVLYEDNESLLLALSKGEIDAIVTNYASGKYSAGQLGILNIKADEIMDNEADKLGMAINKDKPMLASILNKALSMISEEDKILIRNKWLGVESKPDYSKIYRYIFILVSIALGIILIFFFWNRLLKKQQEETNKALEKVKTLFKVSSALKSTINLDEVMKTILNGLKEVVFLRLLQYRNIKRENLR
jgi:ABC-type amino acid transport substrate-binding protein